jgi:hypothetical protein
MKKVMLLAYGIMGVFVTFVFIVALFERIMDTAVLLLPMVVFGWYLWWEDLKDEMQS